MGPWVPGHGWGRLGKGRNPQESVPRSRLGRSASRRGGLSWQVEPKKKFPHCIQYDEDDTKVRLALVSDRC